MDFRTLMALGYFIPLFLVAILSYVSQVTTGLIFGWDGGLSFIGWMVILGLAVLGLVIFIKAEHV